MTQPLWSIEAMTTAMQAVRSGVLPEAITGISIDSRTIKAGEAYFDGNAGDRLDAPKRLRHAACSASAVAAAS